MKFKTKGCKHQKYEFELKEQIYLYVFKAKNIF